MFLEIHTYTPPHAHAEQTFLPPFSFCSNVGGRASVGARKPAVNMVVKSHPKASSGIADVKAPRSGAGITVGYMYKEKVTRVLKAPGSSQASLLTARNTKWIRSRCSR